MHGVSGILAPCACYEQAVMEGRITLGFNKKKTRIIWKKIPVRNPEFSWKEDQQGIVTVDMVHKGIFDKLAQKLWVTPRVSHVKLDRFRKLCMEADGRKQEYHCHRSAGQGRIRRPG